MSRTYRHWTFMSVKWWNCEHWKITSMSFYGYHKARRVRKEIRHSIRCINRTMFAHGIYEPIIEIGGEYFD
ncbi:hypothetical protein GQ473_06130 [archaeon]|nr:hypothetical protein [archaeon]